MRVSLLLRVGRSTSCIVGGQQPATCRLSSSIRTVQICTSAVLPPSPVVPPSAQTHESLLRRHVHTHHVGTKTVELARTLSCGGVNNIQCGTFASNDEKTPKRRFYHVNTVHSGGSHAQQRGLRRSHCRNSHTSSPSVRKLPWFVQAERFGNKLAVSNAEGETFSFQDLLRAADKVKALVSAHTVTESAPQQRGAESAEFTTKRDGTGFPASSSDTVSEDAGSGPLSGDLAGQTVVVFLVQPSELYPAVLYGAWKAGAVAVPLHYKSAPSDWEYVIENCSPNLIIVDDKEKQNKLESVAARFKSRLRRISQADLFPVDRNVEPKAAETVASISSASTTSASSSSNLSEIYKVLKSADETSKSHSNTEYGENATQNALDRPAMIVYTSGSTNKPKGVIHSHRSLTTAVVDLLWAWDWRSSDHILHFLPLHHVHGIVNKLLCPLFVGASVEFLTSASPSVIWRRLSQQQERSFAGDSEELGHTIIANSIEREDCLRPDDAGDTKDIDGILENPSMPTGSGSYSFSNIDRHSNNKHHFTTSSSYSDTNQDSNEGSGRTQSHATGNSSPSVSALESSFSDSTARDKCVLPPPSVFMAVPTIYAQLLDSSERSEAAVRTLRALRLVVSGSMSCPVSVGRRWQALTGTRLIQRYGMTEICMALAQTVYDQPQSEDERASTFGYVGTPLPSMEVMIVDQDTGRRVREQGRSGELWVRGGSIFQRYLNNEAATAEAFVDYVEDDNDNADEEQLTDAPTSASRTRREEGEVESSGEGAGRGVAGGTGGTTEGRVYGGGGDKVEGDNQIGERAESRGEERRGAKRQGTLGRIEGDRERGPTHRRASPPPPPPSLWNRAASNSKWFRTGDIVVLDPSQGQFRISGRASADILKSGGYKLSALEIEHVLIEHPQIAECYVCGAPDAVWGQRVAVVARPTGAAHTLTLTDLQTWARNRLSAEKLPRALFVTADIPKNAMGKVNKKYLATLFEDGSAGRAKEGVLYSE